MRRMSKEEKKLEKEKKKEDKKRKKRRGSGASEDEERDKVKGDGPSPPQQGKTRQSAFDIDPNDPSANKAATKIQATYRGHKERQSLRQSMTQKHQGDSPTKAQLEQEFSPDDTELCNAAVKIQASFRGHMARKQAPKGKPEEDLSRELQKLDAKAEEEELDIDLSDPDLHKAATKIQASFRGHKVRKETEPKEGEGGSEGASQ